MHCKLSYTMAAAAGLVSWAHAHGNLANPQHLPNTTPFTNIRIPRNGCGEGVDVSGEPTATFRRGEVRELTWHIDTGAGGGDGGGPLSARFDPSGNGNNFDVGATVIQDVIGFNGGIGNDIPRGDHPLIIEVPDIECEACVLQVRQDISGNEGFGSCIVVRIE